MMAWLGSYWVWQWGLRLLMALVILRRRQPPSVALAWLAVVFLEPVVGVVFYVLFGVSPLGRRRVRTHQRIIASMRVRERLELGQISVLRPDLEPAMRTIATAAERIGGMPALAGNSVEFLDETHAMIAHLIADIDAAQHHVHMAFYIIEPDDTGRAVTEALCRAAKRGVACRVLADHAGSWRFFHGYAGLDERLRAAGVQVQAMLPVNPIRRGLSRLDVRNHRKLAIVDGTIAFTGSQNVCDSAFGRRKVGALIDLTGRFKGPVVAQMQCVFLEDWACETEQELRGDEWFPTLPEAGGVIAQTLPTGPSRVLDAFPLMMLEAVHQARRQIILSTPYLILDEPMMTALQLAAQRGVEVQVIVPRASDHFLIAAAGRACYEPLLEAGVGVWLFQPGFLHSKTLTVDDHLALLGSTNMDIRSFYINYELNVVMYGAEIAARLRFAQMGYLNLSHPLDLDHWRRRPMARQFLESAAALASPLL